MLTKKVKTKEIFAKRLRASRESLGMTQAELAEALGSSIDVTAISRYEAGNSYPRTERLHSLAEILGVSSSYLSGHEEEEASLDLVSLRLALTKAKIARDELDQVVRSLELATRGRLDRNMPTSAQSVFWGRRGIGDNDTRGSEDQADNR